MRPLGKAMKIGKQQGRREDVTLQMALNSYRQTPHTAAKIAPGAFLFRDGMKSDLPRISGSENDAQDATVQDKELKMRNQEKVIHQSTERKASSKLAILSWYDTSNAKSNSIQSLWISHTKSLL